MVGLRLSLRRSLRLPRIKPNKLKLNLVEREETSSLLELFNNQLPSPPSMVVLVLTIAQSAVESFRLTKPSSLRPNPSKLVNLKHLLSPTTTSVLMITMRTRE